MCQAFFCGAGTRVASVTRLALMFLANSDQDTRNKMSATAEEKRIAAREVIDILEEISVLLVGAIPTATVAT